MNAAIEEIIKVLEQRKSQQSLFPKSTWDTELEQKIEELKRFGTSTEIITVIAGLHLCNDNLHLSHSYAQKIEHDATGAYWHGIMHRMEQDYWNAKYWFRQAGKHPVMSKVQQRAAEWLTQNWSGQVEDQQSAQLLQSIQQGGWNSAQFCDLVEKSEELDSSLQTLLRQIQAIEVNMLLEYSIMKIS